MILKPKDGSYILPAIETPDDLFKYIAGFNEFDFYETDLEGVIPNEIAQNYFFANRIDLAWTQFPLQEIKYDGYLFVGVPSNPAEDINGSDYDNGQFQNIVKDLLTKDFIWQLQLYIKCDFKIQITNLRPLYNSNKYTKSTNTTGVEIFYSIWI